MDNRRMEIRIEDLLRAIVKNRILIIIFTLIGLFLGMVLTVVSYLRGEMTKQYAIKSSIAVTSKNEDGLFTSMTNDPNSTDIHLAEDMVDAVMYVIKSDTTLNAAAEEINLVGVSIKDIYQNLELKQYNETQIIEMTLYWRSAEEGVQILNAINKVAPKVLIETLKIGDVTIVNEPNAKYRIGGNINAIFCIYIAFVGFALGIGFSVLRLLFLPTITNVRDMTKLFSVEVLGEIPENRNFYRSKLTPLSEDPDNIGRNLREEYASCAHFIQYRLKEEKNARVYVTSSEANEGKTNVAAHLAVHFSDFGKKVLLVDFDVRNPTLGSIFLDKIEYGHSLNALYRGDATVEKAITQLTGNLDLLPAILEREELPLREDITELIRKLSESYDLVIMDTAPIGQVADSMNLNRIANDVLFVVRYDHTTLNSIRNALERLDKTGVHIMGCVVNRVKNLNRTTYNYYNSYRARKHSDHDI